MQPSVLLLLLCSIVAVPWIEGKELVQEETAQAADYEDNQDGLLAAGARDLLRLKGQEVKRNLGSAMRLRGKKNMGSAMRLGYKKNMGSAMRLRYKKNMGSAMRLRYKKNMGSAMRLRYKKNMGSAMRLRYKKNMGSAMRLRYKKNMGSAMRLRYKRHVGMPWRWSQPLAPLKREFGSSDDQDWFDGWPYETYEDSNDYYADTNRDEYSNAEETVEQLMKRHLGAAVRFGRRNFRKRYLGSAMRFRSLASSGRRHQEEA